MVKPKVYTDFQNADRQGRLRLNCVGTLEDLSRQGVELHDGLRLSLYSDDVDDQGRLDELLVEGTVAFSKDEQCWVAVIDWTRIHHASDVVADGIAGPAVPVAGESTRAEQSK